MNLRSKIRWSLAFALFAVSCKKNDEKPVLNVDRSSISVTSEAGKEYVELTSNTAWKISGLPEGMNAKYDNGTSNAKVELSYQANASAN